MNLFKSRRWVVIPDAPRGRSALPRATPSGTVKSPNPGGSHQMNFWGVAGRPLGTPKSSSDGSHRVSGVFAFPTGPRAGTRPVKSAKQRLLSHSVWRTQGPPAPCRALGEQVPVTGSHWRLAPHRLSAHKSCASAPASAGIGCAPQRGLGSRNRRFVQYPA